MLALVVSLIDIAILWFAGAGALMLFIATMAGATLLVSTWIAPDRPPGAGLGVADRAALWVGEIAAAWSVFLFWMPLERWCMRRDLPGRRPQESPVLLLHGYINNAGSMWRLWLALRDARYGVYTLNLEPIYADIDGYAALIEARIKEIRTRTGAAHVILVCHSMGGLAARAYLRRCAQNGTEAGLAKVVTLGSPHQGTRFARFESSTNGHQMVEGSAWLAALAGFEQKTWPCPLISIYSLDDNIVTPPQNSHLDGARNIVLKGIGHISLPLSRRVIDLVQAEMGSENIARP